MLICVMIATVDFVILLNPLFQKITQLKGGKARTKNVFDCYYRNNVGNFGRIYFRTNQHEVRNKE